MVATPLYLSKWILARSRLTRILFLQRYVKEGLALRYDLLKELVWDPHVLEVEEADFHQGVPEVSQERGLGLWIAGQSQVQDGDRRERHIEELQLAFFHKEQSVCTL